MRLRIAIAAGCFLLAGLPAAAQATEPAAVRGLDLYTTMCATCHGPYGRGDGPALQYLEVRPPDFTEPTFFGARSDDAIVTALLEKAKHPETAHSPMVMAGVVKEASLRDAVHYARNLGAPGVHASLAAGRDVYVSICWACHGVTGNGQGPSAKNLAVRPRDFTSKEFRITGREDEIYKTIALGAEKSFHGSASMIAWKGALTDQQIKDVMAYIALLKQQAGS